MNLGLPDNAVSNLVNYGLDASDSFLKGNGLNMYRLAASYLQPNINSLIEIGCGYGAGAYYISKYLKVTHVHGIDANCLATAYASERYSSINGLTYQCLKMENALSLHRSFDAVVSVEAAMHFKSHETFIEILAKLLNDDGQFVFVDILTDKQRAQIEKQLMQNKLVVNHFCDVSDEVIQSILNTDSSGGVLKYIEKLVLDINNSNFTKQSKLFKRLENNETHYVLFAGRKKAKPQYSN